MAQIYDLAGFLPTQEANQIFNLAGFLPTQELKKNIDL